MDLRFRYWLMRSRAERLQIHVYKNRPHLPAMKASDLASIPDKRECPAPIVAMAHSKALRERTKADTLKGRISGQIQ